MPCRTRNVAEVLPPLTTRCGRRAFTVEACWRTTKQRLIDTFERVDADYRVKALVDSAGDDGHYAASGADVEFRSSTAECISGYQRGLFDQHRSEERRV